MTKWEEYKLYDGTVIKVPYNCYNVAPITKKLLEELIKAKNECILREVERLNEQMQKGE